MHDGAGDLAGVFDDRQAMLFSEVAKRRHVRKRAMQVGDEDGFDCRRMGAGQLLDVERPAASGKVNQHGASADCFDRAKIAREVVACEDNFVA